MGLRALTPIVVIPVFKETLTEWMEEGWQPGLSLAVVSQQRSAIGHYSVAWAPYSRMKGTEQETSCHEFAELLVPSTSDKPERL